ncbi:Mycolyl transferase 85A [Nocardia brasiliensis]|nr:alpha/beta hydrolase family protein [Nocardia brasiliensis]SUB40399.1 Mycolyl transferase 85A [Nocardia brasiliensis]
MLVSGTAAVLVSLTGGGLALAAEAPIAGGGGVGVSQLQSANGSRIVDVASDNGRNFRVTVYSAAMNRNIPVEVQHSPAPGKAPTLYLLNGGGGGEDAATWQRQTDVLDFLARRHVNVVQPVGGKFSYYTDWDRPDPVLGVNKWRTFLTEELPPLVDDQFRGSGVNAIAGLSMAATSVLQLATARPDLYKSVAAYSGAPGISDPVGRSLVETVVSAGGGDVTNMYGPPGSPGWAANDPCVQAEKLRGKHIFISAGTGMPGIHDQLGDPHLIAPGPIALSNQIIVGGLIETEVHKSTIKFRNRLESLGISATYDVDRSGSHSWGYWQDMFKESWPVLAAGLGVPR